MNSTNGLNALFLTECFLKNYQEQLKIATTEKAIQFLKFQIHGLQNTLQTFYN